jgi:hypothetical protein
LATLTGAILLLLLTRLLPGLTALLLLAGFLTGLIALLLLTRVLVGVLVLIHSTSFQRWLFAVPARTLHQRPAVTLSSKQKPCGVWEPPRGARSSFPNAQYQD